MAMKIYKVGYGDLMETVVAENESEAIQKVVEKFPNFNALPLSVTRFEKDGYTLVALSEQDKAEIDRLQLVEEHRDELKEEVKSLKEEIKKLTTKKK